MGRVVRKDHSWVAPDVRAGGHHWCTALLWSGAVWCGVVLWCTTVYSGLVQSDPVSQVTDPLGNVGMDP